MSGEVVTDYFQRQVGTFHSDKSVSHQEGTVITLCVYLIETQSK
jgi:hypothetical protein